LKTILVPTDFSAASKMAAQYAVRLAVHMKAKVTLLSIVEIEMETAVLRNWKVLEKQMRESATKGLSKLQAELSAGKHGVEISTDIAAGVPMEDVIENYAVTKKVSVVVMGTKGATGLRRILSGSNTATVIAKSSVPVMAIPSKVAFNAPKKFVYASDLTNLTSEIRLLARIAKQFQAEVLILNTITSGSSKIDKKLVPDAISKTRYPAISFHQIQSKSTVEGINKFVKDQKADLLVMFTHELDFYDKLLGKSVTRTMAFQSHIPLLVYNRS